MMKLLIAKRSLTSNFEFKAISLQAGTSNTSHLLTLM
jgi:hypothetical protein